MVYAKVYASALNTLALAVGYGGIRLAQWGGTAIQSSYYFASAQAYAGTQFASQAAQNAYTATYVFLAQNSNIAYEAASMFTGAMGLTPGPVEPGNRGAIAGELINSGPELMEAVFEAWMKSVCDPETQ